MLAFLIDCNGEHGEQVYFAEKRGQAKAMAANEEGVDFTDVVSVRRKPEFDQYAPGPVPIPVLLAAGWWYECWTCSQHVYEHTEDAVVEQSRVWCSDACRKRGEAREERDRAQVLLMETRAREATLARFPGVTIHRVIQPYHLDEPLVHFRVPGMADGYVAWEVGSKFVHVAPSDYPAWEAYEVSRLASSSPAPSN